MTYQLWNSLIQHGLSPNQIYFLSCCQNKIIPSRIINADAERIICQSKGYLDSEGKLTDKARILLEEFESFVVKAKRKVTSEILGENFLDKIKEYRELFPAQRFPSGELARQSIQELKDKFVWFFKTYPDFEWNLILDATEYYLYTKSKDNFMYTATSSYFIQKTDTKTKVSKSLLADYCQTILDNPEVLKS